MVTRCCLVGIRVFTFRAVAITFEHVTRFEDAREVHLGFGKFLIFAR